MKVFIKYKKVYFTQGCQTFSLAYEGSKKELEWLAKMLEKAFENFSQEIKTKTIEELKVKQT